MFHTIREMDKTLYRSDNQAYARLKNHATTKHQKLDYELLSPLMLITATKNDKGWAQNWSSII